MGYSASGPSAISELKLDRAFIIDFCTNPKDAVIVEATQDLARKLGLVMVAAGVEDAPSLVFLQTIKCDQVQGYILCRPQETVELERRLPLIYQFRPAAGSDPAGDGESDST